jgi:hypothetical protein
MMAISRKVPTEALSDIEALLPWHAAGTLSARDARRVDAVLAKNQDLARQYAAIRQEYSETVSFNESLGSPSSRAMHELFAAIDAEPARGPRLSPSRAARIAGFLARLQTGAVAAVAAVAALILLVQAVVIGAMLMQQPIGWVQMTPARTERHSMDRGAYALVRFAPEARVSEISDFLAMYQASIVDVATGGMFRLQFNDTTIPAADLADLLGRLQNEKVLSLAVAAR